MNSVLPEVNFSTSDPQEIVDDVVSAYEKLSGRKLFEGDPVYIIILAFSSALAEAHAVINHAARQNLLYYASDDMLDHKGYPWDTPRIGNDYSRTTILFTTSRSLESGKVIPKGERVTNNAGTIIFETTEEVVISPGEREVFVPAQCTEPGVIGNGLEVGELDALVVPISYITRVENITVSSGGTQPESDDDYRKRIRMASEKLSTAGSGGAYEYHTKKVSADIEDVLVDSPGPGKVHVSILMKDGRLPEEEEVQSVLETLSSNKVRPLTDFVTVGPPETREYDLDVVYYIDKNAVDKALIQQNIEKAVTEYEIWQSRKIGRDFNPSQLTAMCVRAGAKRVVVNSPTYEVVERGEVAVLKNRKVEFGGEEDD